MFQFEYGLRALSANIQICAYERAPRHLFVFLLSLTCDVMIYSALPHPRNRKNTGFANPQKHWRSQLSFKKCCTKTVQKTMQRRFLLIVLAMLFDVIKS